MDMNKQFHFNQVHADKFCTGKFDYVCSFNVRLYTCIVENNKCGWAFLHITHINNKKRPSIGVKF